jgi:hypothetical protein
VLTIAHVEENDKDASITHLALRTYRNANFSSCGELQSLETKLFHASIRLYSRVRGDPGAVAGMFTYFNDSTESDIEILTRDSIDQIWYTNQPNTDSKGHTIAAAGTQAVLPSDVVWTDWIVHRLDWLPEISQWYVNGIFVANKTYGVPTSPSYLMLNMVSTASRRDIDYL